MWTISLSLQISLFTFLQEDFQDEGEEVLAPVKRDLELA